MVKTHIFCRCIRIIIRLDFWIHFLWFSSNIRFNYFCTRKDMQTIVRTTFFVTVLFVGFLLFFFLLFLVFFIAIIIIISLGVRGLISKLNKEISD